MSTHTPRPWYTRQRTDTRDAILILKRNPVYPQLETEIAQVNTPDGSEEGKANARLIAAAPELLEVLQTIENDGKQVPAWLWDNIQTAVFNATGESKGNQISPIAGRSDSPAGSGRNAPGQSSEGKAKQRRTPGEPHIGGNATQFLRRLDGRKGPRPIKDP